MTEELKSPFDWTITAKKILLESLKVGAVAAATAAAALPDSFWGQVFAAAHLSGPTLMVATLVGIPTIRGLLNTVKNW